jgi:hypothetical protein
MPENCTGNPQRLTVQAGGKGSLKAVEKTHHTGRKRLADEATSSDPGVGDVLYDKLAA